MVRRLVIASTFAADPVLPVLSYWLERHRLDVELTLAPYGQVLEQVATAEGELAASSTDLGVLLIRLEDYLRDEEARLRLEPDALHRAMGNVEELAAAVSSCVGVGGGPILIGVMPATAGDTGQQFVMRGRRVLEECADANPSVSWLDFEGALDLYQVREVADPFRDEIAHIPFSDECLTTIGTAIARQVRALWGQPCKVIALDCDNTLWRGACSEDPIHDLDPSGPFEYLRTFMREQARSGRLLCLVSRNPEQDVERAFARHGAPLTDEDVVARRCGWEAKPDSLRSIAAELDLDVGSFVFVDDDPVECAAVRDQLPSVPVVEVPRDPARIRRVLRHAWELDLAFVTEADRQRSDSYVANRRLGAERSGARSLESFLDGLQVRVAVTRLQADEVERVVQLFHRTNQFNSTGKRTSARELRERLDSPRSDAWVVRVEDRLGDYGLVGALLTSSAPRTLRLDHIALSCRVFQRRVEQTMLRELLEVLDRRPTRLAIAYRDTGRNVPVRRFIDDLAAEEVIAAENGVRWFQVPSAVLSKSS